MESEMITKNVSEIEEEIRLQGHVEWRSKKNLDKHILSLPWDENTRIVGHITSNTMQKWGIDLGRSFDYVYIGVKNGGICYLRGLEISPSSTHVLMNGIYAQKKYLV